MGLCVGETMFSLLLSTLLLGTTCVPALADHEAGAAFAFTAQSPVKAPNALPAVSPRLANLQQAVGKLIVPIVPGINSNGTGTIVGPRNPDGSWLVLTAYHVGEGRPGKLTLKDGRVLEVESLECNASGDLCWLVTKRKDLEGLPHAILATETPKPGEAIWHCGYGRDLEAWVRHGLVAEGSAPGKVYLTRIVVQRGDSGGAVFDANGKLVGVMQTAITETLGRVGNATAGCTTACRRFRPLFLPAIRRALQRN